MAKVEPPQTPNNPGPVIFEDFATSSNGTHYYPHYGPSDFSAGQPLQDGRIGSHSDYNLEQSLQEILSRSGYSAGPLQGSPMESRFIYSAGQLYNYSASQSLQDSRMESPTMGSAMAGGHQNYTSYQPNPDAGGLSESDWLAAGCNSPGEQ